MASNGIPHFKNDKGATSIRIGVRAFMCMGAASPFDHPHVYLNMGDANEIICPYCSTLYVYDASLKPDQTIPEGCYVSDATA